MRNEFRILLIDDNLEIHNDFKKILTLELKAPSKLNELDEMIFGPEKTASKLDLPVFKIDTASQGEEGVQLIQQSLDEKKPYALAFVDIRMPPGIDGIETIKRIFAIDDKIQIVICTAYSDYSWEKILGQLGQRENLLILKKPFDHVAVRQLAMALTIKWELMNTSAQNTRMLENMVKERTENLEFQALHDPLTSMPNRQFLFNYLSTVISRSEHMMSLFALMFIDLDRFKWVNDSFSHAVGDELLIQVAERLRSNVRGADFIARLGGDEFVIVAIDFASIHEVKIIGDKLIKAFEKPFVLQETNVIVPASIGISVFPYDGTKADDLIKCADLAMYRAKELGGGQYQFYHLELQQENLKRLQLQTELRTALNNQEFFLVYQPQVDLQNNKILSLEALLRWRHPERGVLTPIDFIPMAEDIGLFSTLGDWVTLEACSQVVKWQKEGLPPIKVAVNVTTHQFKQPDLVEKIKKTLQETGLAPEFLEIEITENVITTQVEAINKISQLKALGVSVAIDDFGTGYSTLGYLKNMSLDKLKIDRSFVQNIDVNRSDEVIIQAIIAVAGSLNLNVVAEGIETERQLEFLSRYKSVDGQGYYFSRPLAANDIEKWIKEH